MNHVCVLQVPDESRLFDYIRQNASMSHDMVETNEALAGSVAICGAGPSLSLARGFDALNRTDEVWACNSALPFLADRGNRVTHGFAIDQSEGMLDDWKETYDVTYLLASSVNPKLVEHLKGRKIRWFHSYLGIPGPETDTEMQLYKKLYPDSVQVGHGLNSVPRAVCLALAMGFSDIRVYGVDCAAAPNQPEMPETGEPGYWEWMQGITLYADGKKASTYGESVMCEAVIDGRRWTTRPDMIISAQWLVKLAKAFPKRITLVGDTLPNALMGKGEDFWRNMPVLGDGNISNLRTMKVA